MKQITLITIILLSFASCKDDTTTPVNSSDSTVKKGKCLPLEIISYDASGNPNGSKVVYTYDGNIQTQTTYEKDGKSYVSLIAELNEYGERISLKLFDENGNQIVHQTTTYLCD